MVATKQPNDRLSNKSSHAVKPFSYAHCFRSMSGPGFNSFTALHFTSPNARKYSIFELYVE